MVDMLFLYLNPPFQLGSKFPVDADTADSVTITIEAACEGRFVFIVILLMLKVAIFPIADAPEVVFFGSIVPDSVTTLVGDVGTEFEVFAFIAVSFIDTRGQQVELVRGVDHVGVILCAGSQGLPVNIALDVVNGDIAASPVHGQRVGVFRTADEAVICHEAAFKIVAVGNAEIEVHIFARPSV